MTEGGRANLLGLPFFRDAHNRARAAEPRNWKMLLIIAETTQQALVRNEPSLTNAFILIATFFTLEIAFSRFTQRWPGSING